MIALGKPFVLGVHHIWIIVHVSCKQMFTCFLCHRHRYTPAFHCAKTAPVEYRKLQCHESNSTASHGTALAASCTWIQIVSRYIRTLGRAPSWACRYGTTHLPQHQLKGRWWMCFSNVLLENPFKCLEKIDKHNHQSWTNEKESVWNQQLHKIS